MVRVSVPVWSRLDRTQRILLLTVVGVVVAFVASVASSGRAGPGDVTTARGGLVGWLGDRFGRAPDAPLRDLSGDCVTAPGQLTVTAVCVLHVGPSTTRTRQVRLTAHSPVEVTARAPRGDGLVTRQVAAETEVSVAVDDGGGDIRITCAAQRCVVVVNQGGH